jgi:iron complex outermembrane receptor protein
LSQTRDINGNLLYPGTGPQPDAGESDLLGVRGQLLWEPSEVFTLLTKLQYDNSQGTTNIFHPVAAVTDANGRVVFPNPDGTGPRSPLFGPGCSRPDGNCFLETDTDETAYGNAQRNDNTSKTAVVRADWKFGENTLTSVSGYNKYDRNFLEDCDGSPWNTCQNSYIFDSEQYSEELRVYIPFDRARITTGVYYLQQDAAAHYAAPVNMSLALPIPFPILFQSDYELEVKSYAAFVNVEYDIAPQWTAVVGGRITRDEKQFNETLRQWYPRNYTGGPLLGQNSDSWYFTGPGLPLGGGAPNGDCGNPTVAATRTGDCIIAQNLYNDTTAPGLTEIKDDLWTAKAELDWKPTDDLLIYAFVNRGVKSGGFNNGYYEISANPVDIPYQPEELLDYELGFKSKLLEGRATLNAGVFYYDYKDKQTIVYLSSLTSQGNFTLNQDATIMGGEVEFQMQATDRLFVSLGAGLLDSEVKDMRTGAGFLIEDAEALLAPQWSANALVRYELPLAANSTLGLQLDGSGHAAMWGNSFNDPASRLDGFWLTNARVDWTSGSGAIKLSAYVKNVTDERKAISSHTILGIGDYINYQYTPPRWWGISVAYNWR